MAVNKLLKQVLLYDIEENFDAVPFLMELHPEYTGVVLYHGTYPLSADDKKDYVDTLLSIANDFIYCGFEFEVKTENDRDDFCIVYHWRHDYDDKILHSIT